jgi:2-methylcitrate dehydratase PrpD
VSGVKFEDFDPATVERAKERLIDSLGVMMIGHRAPDIPSTVEQFFGYGGTQESTVVSTGKKLPMHNAAFFNSLIMRSYDFEAIDAEAVIEGENTVAAHISGSTVPAALAIAEKTGASGKDLLHALIVGDDIAARAANATGFSVHDYFDSNGTVNILGATTTAGLLLGLSPDEIHAAYTLAINFMGGTMQNVFEKKLTFKLPIALSARNSILAAEFAQHKYNPGLSDPLGGPRGFFELFFSNPAPKKFLHKIGEKFVADVIIKPWPACRATHASINATLDALGGKTFKSTEIKRVKIHVTEGIKSFVGVGFEFGMDQQFQGAFSIDFLVATAILRGNVLPEFYEPEKMVDPDIGAILNKLTILSDLPNEKGMHAATVEIELADGTVLAHETSYAKGDYYKTRFTCEELLNKYYSNVDYGAMVSKEIADKMVSTIAKIEEVDNVSELIGHLA